MKCELINLSETQLQFWFEYLTNKNGSSYHIVSSCYIYSELDHVRFSRTLDILKYRHHALITSFSINKDGVVKKYLNESINLKLKYNKFLGDDPENFYNFCKNLYSTKIDLLSSELFSFYLCKYSDECYGFAVLCPHILFDGESFAILLNDLLTIYNSDNVTSLYKNFPISQFDQPIKGDNKAIKLSYWKQQLKDIYSIEKFPNVKYDGTRSLHSKHNNSIKYDVDGELRDDLKRTQRECKVTKYTIYLTALAIFYSKLIDNQDILIGIPISQRIKNNDQIGAFINALPLKLTVCEDHTIVKCLKSTMRYVHQCMNNAEVSINEIIKALNININSAENKIYNVMLDNVNLLNKEMHGFKVKQLYVEGIESKFDFSITMVEDIDKLMIVIEYDPNKYDANIVKEWGCCYINILKIIINSKPTKLINSIKLCDEKQLNTIERISNGKAILWPQINYIDAYYEALKKYDNNLIFKFNEQEITFRELENLSNNLAQVILTYISSNTNVVAIKLERSIDLVIAIIAIIKCGITFITIDPAMPLQREKYILDQAKPNLIISSLKIKIDIELRERYSIYRLNILHLMKKQGSNYTNYAWRNKIAYIIFTSGTTGNPKGIKITQKGMMNHLYMMIHYFDITVVDIIAQTAAQSFDIFIWQMICGLLVGSKTVIYEKNKQLDVFQFSQELCKDKVSILEHVPSYINELCETHYSENKRNLKNIKHLILTGESSSTATINKIKKYYPKVAITNAYGPAEASDDITFYRVGCDIGSHKGNKVPIGKPSYNVKLYILDKFMHFCPIGKKGQIYVGGDCLFAGYLNSDKLTDQKIIKLEINGSLEKLYATGDIGLWDETYNVIFCGRVDNQVKLRGQRIELEDVENNIKLLKGIVDAGCIIKNDILIACYVSEKNIYVQDIIDKMNKLMPVYMHPKKFINVKQLPYTGNGKLDRIRLQQIKVGNEESRKIPINIENDLTARILNIWKKVLNNQSLTIKDNFFQCGGDSLKAIQVVHLLLKSSIHITIKDIYSSKSIINLANQVSRCISYEEAVAGQLYPLLPVQNIYLSRKNKFINYLSQVAVLKLKDVNLNHLHDAFNKLIEIHEIFNVCFLEEKGKIRQKIVKDNVSKTIEIEISNSASLHDTIENSIKSLSLLKNRLYKFTIVDINDDKYLIVCIHHALIDALSWDIILQDLDKLLIESTCNNRLDSYYKTTSYLIWAQYCNQLKTMNHSINNHHKPMGGISTRIKHYDIGSVKNIKIKVDEKYLNLYRNETTLLQSLILYALCQSYVNIYEKKSVIIDIENNGRYFDVSDHDLTRSVGWFTNIFPIKFQMNDDNYLETILNIKNQLLEGNALKLKKSLLRSAETDKIYSNSTIHSPICFNYLGEIKPTNNYKYFTSLGLAEQSKKYNLLAGPYSIEADVYICEGNCYIEFCYIKEILKKISLNEFFCKFKDKLLKFLTDKKTNLILKYYKKCGTNKISIDRVRNIIDRNSQCIEKIYPVTGIARGMLFHSLLHEEQPLYYEQCVLQINQNLDYFSFKKTVDHVIDKIELLRVTIDLNHDEPVYVVSKNRKPDLNYIDTRKRSNSDQLIETIINNVYHSKFQFSEKPPIKFNIIHNCNNTWLFIITYHHVLLAANDFKELVTLIFKLYKMNKGRSINQEKVIEFRPNNNHELTKGYNAAKAFWKKYLSNQKFKSEIESKSALKTQIAYAPKSVQLKTIEIAKRYNVTKNILFMSVWGMVLAEFIKNDQIYVGVNLTPPSLEQETEDLFSGIKVNTIPFKIKLDTSSKINEYLMQNQNHWSDVYEHSVLPYSEILRACSLYGFDIFESLYVYNENELLNDKLNRYISVFKVRETTNYKLILDIVNSDRKLEYKLTYDSAIYQEQDIKNILKRFNEILNKHIDIGDYQLGKFLKIKNLKITHNNVQTKTYRYVENRNTPLIVGAIKKTLNTSDIKMEDNLFNLGMDSIHALKIANDLVKKGINITVFDLFKNQTIGKLLNYLSINSFNLSQIAIDDNVPKVFLQVMQSKYDHNLYKVIKSSYLQSYIYNNILKNDKQYLYHDLSIMEYKGDIDHQIFEDAWNEIIKKLPMFRTRFVEYKSKCYQVILKKNTIKLNYYDFTNFSSSQSNKNLTKVLNEEQRNYFNLDTDILIRIKLIKMPSNLYKFILCFNVIIMDGWCFAAVMKAFYDTYHNLMGSKYCNLNFEPHYESYINWLNSQELNQAKIYWSNYLKSANTNPYVKRLGDKRKLLKQYSISKVKTIIHEDETREIKKYAINLNVTLNSLMQFLWGKLLLLSSKQSSIVFGVTVAGRPATLESSDKIIGLMFNDIPVIFEQNYLDQDISIAVQKFQTQFNASRCYEYISKEMMQQQKDEDDLFQSLLVYENYPKDDEDYLKSVSKYFENTGNWRREISDIDLTVYIEVTSKVEIEFRYLDEILPKTTLEVLLNNYKNILISCVEEVSVEN